MVCFAIGKAPCRVFVLNVFVMKKKIMITSMLHISEFMMLILTIQIYFLDEKHKLNSVFVIVAAEGQALTEGMYAK